MSTMEGGALMSTINKSVFHAFAVHPMHLPTMRRCAPCASIRLAPLPASTASTPRSR